jgi:hypothetical protein
MLRNPKYTPITQTKRSKCRITSEGIKVANGVPAACD